MFSLRRFRRHAAFLTALILWIAHGVSLPAIQLDVESQEGAIVVHAQGLPGELNRIEVSEDLVHWRVAAVMFNSTGQVEFIPEAGLAKAQFFRAAVALPEQQLEGLSVPPAISETGAEFVPVTESGGVLSRDGVRVQFKAGEVAGSVRAALVPGPVTLPSVSRGVGRSGAASWAIILRGHTG